MFKVANSLKEMFFCDLFPLKEQNNWDKVFKSGLRKFCGRQPLKNVLSLLLNTLFQL